MESGVRITIVTLAMTLWCHNVTCFPFLHAAQRAENATDWKAAANDMSNRLTRLTTDLLNQSQQITDLKKQLDSFMQPPVAFTASLSGEDLDRLKVGDVVKFSHVLHNAGEGYDPQTGLFTPPETGQYLFYVSVARRGSNKARHSCVEASLYRDWEKLFTTKSFCFHNDNPSSSLVPLVLSRGNTVHVRIVFGNSAVGSLLVSLSGIKI